jgi:hypothetical protein
MFTAGWLVFVHLSTPVAHAAAGRAGRDAETVGCGGGQVIARCMVTYAGNSPRQIYGDWKSKTEKLQARRK